MFKNAEKYSGMQIKTVLYNATDVARSWKENNLNLKMLNVF